jgi:hypothetical protein
MDNLKEHRFAAVDYRTKRAVIKWIRLAPSRGSDQGIFIFHHEDLSTPCKYDDWFETLDQAFKHAKWAYNVDETDWKTADEIIEMGYQILDMDQ